MYVESSCRESKAYRRCLVFWGDFYPSLEGFTSVKDPSVTVFRTYMPNVAAFTDAGERPPESVFCTGKIKHTGSAFVQPWNFLKATVRSDLAKGCKVTMPAPELYHMRYKEGYAYPKNVYRDDGEFFADVARAYRIELEILYENGARNVQIDDPNLACKPRMVLL